MPLSQELSTAIDAAVDRNKESLISLSRRIHQNPELRFEEHKAAAWICELLETGGFAVEKGLGAMPTSFRARARKPGGGRVAILAEYDALPEIGHACGHNLIAAGGVGAFLAAAAVVEKVGGEVVL